MNRRILRLLFIILLLGYWPSGLGALATFHQVKTDNPRDTMRTFMEAMNDYRQGVVEGNDDLRNRIQDGIHCLNLENVPYLMRDKRGKEIAIFLKEVIDRAIVIDYSKIPEKTGSDTSPLLRWRLKGTEIVISRVQKGERAGEYLFSKDTVYNAQKYYKKVRNLPYKEGSGKGALYQPSWLERNVPSWAKKSYVGMYVWQWAGVLLFVLIGLVLKVLAGFTARLLLRVTSKSSIVWDKKLLQAVANPIGYLVATAFWFASLYILRLEGMAFIVLSVVVQIVLSVSVIWLLYRLANVFTEYLTLVAAQTDSTLDDQLVPLVNRTLKIFVVVVGVLAAIQNLGINVMSLIAGLGIGGLAFALAARDMVANLFGSVMILMDRPFQVGDWIVVPGAEGTVQEIGFRSTRILTFYNSIVSIPNSDLASAKIDNMGLREYRRVYATLGITYDTPAEKIEGFLEGIKNIIKANSYTRKDLYHVVLNQFASHSLDVMVYFFLKVPDWSSELVEKQNVFLEVIRLADDMGVRFAFPTQSIHVESMPAEGGVKQDRLDVNRLRQVAQSYGPQGQAARPGGQGVFVPPYKETP